MISTRLAWLTAEKAAITAKINETDATVPMVGRRYNIYVSLLFCGRGDRLARKPVRAGIGLLVLSAPPMPAGAGQPSGTIEIELAGGRLFRPTLWSTSQYGAG